MKGVWDYWSKVLAGEKKFPWFGAALVIAAITVVKPSYVLYTKGMYVVARLPKVVSEIIEQKIPEDFNLQASNGTMSTTMKTPVKIELNREDVGKVLEVFGENDSWDGENDSYTILTIDPEASAEDYDPKKSAVLLTSRSLVFPDDNNQIKMVQVSEMGTFALDKPTIMGFVKLVEGKEVMKWAKTIVYALPWILFAGVLLFAISAWSWLAMAIWLMGRILSVRPGYWKIFGLVAAVASVSDLVVALLNTTGLSGISNITQLIGIIGVWGVWIVSYFLMKGYGKAKPTIA